MESWIDSVTAFGILSLPLYLSIRQLEDIYLAFASLQLHGLVTVRGDVVLFQPWDMFPSATLFIEQGQDPKAFPSPSIPVRPESFTLKSYL